MYTYTYHLYTFMHIYKQRCGWKTWYAPMGRRLGNSWRITQDVRNWEGVYHSARANENLGKFAVRKPQQKSSIGKSVVRKQEYLNWEVCGQETRALRLGTIRKKVKRFRFGSLQYRSLTVLLACAM
jgi:hypothetical protein